MRTSRLFNLRFASACILFCAAGLPVRAQCGVNSLGFGNIGIVANNPFQAEVVSTHPESSSLDSRLEYVARDGQGRIRTDRTAGKYKHDNGPDAGTEAEERMIMICDPVAQTLTRIDTLNKTATIIHSRPSAPITPATSRLQPAHARTFCSSRLLIGLHLNGEDLGVKTIEGVEAHGEQFTMPMLATSTGGESTSSSTNERWCSDDLSAVVLTVTANSKAGTKFTVAMQKIERIEPDPSLFQIPPDYAITESVAPPLGRRSSSVPASGQP
jgi:hypothetical protein